MTIEFRRAIAPDLVAINEVIAAAVTVWPMAERVKRLSIPVLTYAHGDFSAFDVFVAVDARTVVAVATLDSNYANTKGLLHGLYVLPAFQGRGIGRELMRLAFDAASERGLESVTIKAQRVSATYFAHCGLQPLDVRPPAEEGPTTYPWQFVKQLRHLNQRGIREQQA